MGISDKPISPTEESSSQLSNLLFVLFGVTLVIALLLLIVGYAFTSVGGLLVLLKTVGFILIIISLIFLILGLLIRVMYKSLENKK